MLFPCSTLEWSLIHLQHRSRYIWYKFFSFSHSHICLEWWIGQLLLPTHSSSSKTTTCPPTTQRATSLVHNELYIKSNKQWATASTTSPPTSHSPSNVPETTSTTSSTNTNKRMTQEWTRFVPCWSTALLPLLHIQDRAAPVDTPMTPSPAQVHQRRTLFVEPRAKIVKQTAILYTAPILKNSF